MSGYHFSHEIHRFPRNALFSWRRHINLIKSKFGTEKQEKTTTTIKRNVIDKIIELKLQKNVSRVSIKPFKKIDI